MPPIPPNHIFRLFRRGFAELAAASPQRSIGRKIGEDGERASNLLVQIFGGDDDGNGKKEDRDNPTIETTGEVADEK